MKICEMNLYICNNHFKHLIVTPKVKLEKRKALIIEFITDRQVRYFGECNAFETDWYDDETIEIAREQAIKWFESFKNYEFYHFEEIQQALQNLEQFPATRSMIVMACYQAFYKLEAFHVPYGATVSGVTDENVRNLINTKPQRVKVKWSETILKDVKQLQQLPFKTEIVVDANESIQEDEAKKLKLLSENDILYIEEPFKNIEKIKNFKYDEIPPIAIDEKATSLEKILNYVKNDDVDVVVLKPFRLGGIDKVIQIIDILSDRNVKFVIGGMYEYGLSRYFTALLAQYATYPSDITPQGFYFENDIVACSGILKRGSIYFEPPHVNKLELDQID
ncbi:o-succinylbenzoate synthase [Staphylococcus nepalensis]|uniref:o-succinylbenzoate synthase n=1 Tax=Staphylococcus nepalensis TaxID=214473 RepID=UPI0032E8C264